MSINMGSQILWEDYLLHVDMLEIIRRGSAEIIFGNNRGVLLKDNISDIYMMSAKDIETAQLIINKIPEDTLMMVSHQEFYHDLIVKRFNFKDEMICYNVAYTKKNIIEIPKCKADIRVLQVDNIKQVIENYSSLDLANEEYILERINTKTMFGAFIGEQLCGFVGTHEEGSIGILEVLPKYKGLGIGAALQATATNQGLLAGRYPYGQVKVGNVASITLQKKLGFEISKDKVWWFFK
ncbi:MAG: GNAT family N-acetyltransferase [Clostridium sp.]